MRRKQEEKEQGRRENGGMRMNGRQIRKGAERWRRGRAVEGWIGRQGEEWTDSK